MLILAAGRAVTAYGYIYHCPHTLCRSFIEIAVDAAYHTAAVTPLTPFTNYTIKMAASISVGWGEFRPDVIVKTEKLGSGWYL